MSPHGHRHHRGKDFEPDGDLLDGVSTASSEPGELAGVWPDDQRGAFATSEPDQDAPLPLADSAVSSWASASAAYLDCRLDVQDVATGVDGSTVVIGELDCGTLHRGLRVGLYRGDVLVAQGTVLQIVGEHEPCESAAAGEFVALRLSAISDLDVRAGDVLVG